MTTHLATPRSLIDLPDEHLLGVTGWRTVSQQNVDVFAEATGDRQWIHTDPERAAAGPFGAPIIHGYLTLALAPVLISEVLVIDEVSMAVNYGLNKVRFPAPAPVGSRLRASVSLRHAQPRGSDVEAVITLTVESDGAPRPVCIADVMVLYR